MFGLLEGLFWVFWYSTPRGPWKHVSVGALLIIKQLSYPILPMIRPVQAHSKNGRPYTYICIYI